MAVTGCAFEPENDTPFSPPPGYHEIWAAAQACTGRRGDFNDLRFFTVPGWSFDTPNGPAAATTAGHNIYIAEHWIANRMVVKHEMIHALGIHGHPYHPFVEPCHATWDSAKEDE